MLPRADCGTARVPRPEAPPLTPRIIHQTTSRARLTWEERRLAARLRRLLPGWRYRLWDDAAKAQLMAERFPAHADAWAKLPLGVMRADVARYAFLHEEGGWYFDTDYKLLKPIGPELLAAECVIPLEYDDGDVRRPGEDAEGPGLGNAVMGSAPGYPFWRDLIEHIFAAGAVGAGEAEVVDRTGPGAVTRFYFARRERYPDVLLPPRNRFHPRISSMAMRSSADADTYGVHLNWGGWRGRSPSVAARVLFRRKLNAL